VAQPDLALGSGDHHGKRGPAHSNRHGYRVELAYDYELDGVAHHGEFIHRYDWPFFDLRINDAAQRLQDIRVERGGRLGAGNAAPWGADPGPG
jgi:hypothetical protein